MLSICLTFTGFFFIIFILLLHLYIFSCCFAFCAVFSNSFSVSLWVNSIHCYRFVSIYNIYTSKAYNIKMEFFIPFLLHMHREEKKQLLISQIIVICHPWRIFGLILTCLQILLHCILIMCPLKHKMCP